MNNQKKQGPYEWHACNLTVEKAIQDSDQDGIPDSEDNRPYEPNKDQIDSDKDGIGDVCDNCPNVYNPDQMDMNQNGVGDACEVKDTVGGKTAFVPDITFITRQYDRFPSHWPHDIRCEKMKTREDAAEAINLELLRWINYPTKPWPKSRGYLPHYPGFLTILADPFSVPLSYPAVCDISHWRTHR